MTLREARQATGLRTKDVAREVGVQAETWRRYERGQRPGRRRLRAVARAVGKRVQDIDWPFPVQTDLEDFTS
jgi:transcriptional regulator with XRE-family HTH domain